jgi:hypothetical protein
MEKDKKKENNQTRQPSHTAGTARNLQGTYVERKKKYTQIIFLTQP